MDRSHAAEPGAWLSPWQASAPLHLRNEKTGLGDHLDTLQRGHTRVDQERQTGDGGGGHGACPRMLWAWELELEELEGRVPAPFPAGQSALHQGAGPRGVQRPKRGVPRTYHPESEGVCVLPERCTI